MVHFERNVLSHVPASSMAGVAGDLKAIFKARRQEAAWALAEEFVEPYGGRFPAERKFFLSVARAFRTLARVVTCILFWLMLIANWSGGCPPTR